MCVRRRTRGLLGYIECLLPKAGRNGRTTARRKGMKGLSMMKEKLQPVRDFGGRSMELCNVMYVANVSVVHVGNAIVVALIFVVVIIVSVRCQRQRFRLVVIIIVFV